jgi:broad specificity phosphatase PhoE
MTTFYLLRHGAPQYDMAEARRLIGGYRDLVPLTTQGVEQVEALTAGLRPLKAQLIVSSPMCRSLQTAAILSRRLDLPLEVAFDLHEWLPDLTGRYDKSQVMLAAYEELMRLGGEWPEGETRNWEPFSAVRRRVTAVLEQYAHLERVIVACHAAVIQALTGEVLEVATFRMYKLNE